MSSSTIARSTIHIFRQTFTSKHFYPKSFLSPSLFLTGTAFHHCIFLIRFNSAKISDSHTSTCLLRFLLILQLLLCPFNWSINVKRESNLSNAAFKWELTPQSNDRYTQGLPVQTILGARWHLRCDKFAQGKMSTPLCFL